MPPNPSPKSDLIQPWPQALAALASGQVIGFPTETVWGMGADARSPSAVQALSRLKGRPEGKALQVCCADTEQARHLAESGQPLFEALLTLLPGPLTLVAQASSACPPWLSFEGKVGLRVPRYALTQELLQRWEGPLATTSFNPAGQPSALTWAEAQRYGLASVLLSGETEPGGLPSTVVDCQTGQILREGAVPASVIHTFTAQFLAKR
ncbi:threonylcarbamoyl-AMP synthase [Deinococcus detaillensis]|uniref:L-threonylcarbamoyladenylate synthase n=1 Tax=Deinococcus detaillensis TaxID=2592048 RepID=A0A553UZN6_9DEIO|nr:L-threonylcarbamoyladenylate synthase [Deinococcus detaillensis]TSA85672.1 threonylcarbamoyl-AMP synthase [Deinococcus detaillensis]